MYLKEFLKELSDLTLKYDITIGGCGCCGSPYLSQGHGEDFHYAGDCLDWDKNENQYTCDPNDSELF
jgi:hypothetical protein